MDTYGIVLSINEGVATINKEELDILKSEKERQIIKLQKAKKYRKEYYEKNKDRLAKLREKYKVYKKCESCGILIQQYRIPKHEASKNHLINKAKKEEQKNKKLSTT